MLDVNDIQKLTKVLATKEDVSILIERMDEHEKSFGKMLDILDGLVKRVEDMHAEYVAVKMSLEPISN